MIMTDKLTIVWTEYMRYRPDLRGFELNKIEKVLRYSTERYFYTIIH